MPGIPLEEIVAGVNSTGLVWLWLLRLRALNPRDKYHTLSSEGLERYGVDRFAKYRALRKLEERGLIEVSRANHHSPQVYIVPRSRRRLRGMRS
jgi:DNA-binding PadR family transcriptional regulator